MGDVSTRAIEINQAGLARTQDEYRWQVEARLQLIEGQLLSLSQLIEKQTAVLQQAVVAQYGHGSTVQE